MSWDISSLVSYAPLQELALILWGHKVNYTNEEQTRAQTGALRWHLFSHPAHPQFIVSRSMYLPQGGGELKLKDQVIV